jgi:hypothetical protein
MTEQPAGDDRIDLTRLEGRRVDVSELEANPFDRPARRGALLRGTGSRALFAGVLAAAVLTLAWKLQPAAGPEASRPVTLAQARPVILESTTPRDLREQIVQELRAAQVEAEGYEQLGVNGVDAELPQPVSPEVRAILERHGIPVPSDGSLHVQIRSR